MFDDSPIKVGRPLPYKTEADLPDVERTMIVTPQAGTALWRWLVGQHGRFSANTSIGTVKDSYMNRFWGAKYLIFRPTSVFVEGKDRKFETICMFKLTPTKHGRSGGWDTNDIQQLAYQHLREEMNLTYQKHRRDESVY